MPRLCLLVATTLSVLAASPARAQSGQTVDVDFVRAFFYLSQLTTAQVTPEAIPDGMDPALVPSGVTVLATLTLDHPEGSGAHGQVVAHSDRPAEELFDLLSAAPPTTWGFLESDSHWMGDGYTLAFCSADGAQKARYAIVPDPEGGTFLVFGIEGSCLPEVADETVVVVEMADEIGDGEIIDEPAHRRHRRPGVPEIDPEGEVIQLSEGFGIPVEGREQGGVYSTVWLRDHTVASGAARGATAFQADGWSQLVAHPSDDLHVSVWSRVDEEGRPVIATLTVRARGGGADLSITATR